MTDDLPTPPLPEAIARTRVVAGISVSGAFSRDVPAGLGMTADFSSLRHLGPVDPHVAHARVAADARPMSVWIWARRGQPRDGELTWMVTTAPSGRLD